MPTKTNQKQKQGKKKSGDPAENEVQPSRQADAAVGLGDGLEGAPIEEYEEELELGTEKTAQKNRS